MANDMDAKEITLRYQGGSISMSRGNAKSIFGADFKGLNPGPEPKEVSVKSHVRVNSIGGPTTSVGSYTYQFLSWPRGTASNARAGKVIYMEWEGSGGDFTARVTGSMSKACSFFNDNTTKTLAFRTQRGTEYGPFAGTL